MSEHVVKWRESIEQIAGEHAELHQITGEFLALVQDRASIEVLMASLSRLISLLSEHFASEEDLMGRAGFPERHAHHLLHQACLLQFQNERKHLAMGSPRALADYREMISTWIIGHLRLQDQRLETYLMSQKTGDRDTASA